MAVQTATKVTAAYSDQQIPFAGYQLETWRLPAGTSGDTSVITPSSGRFIVSVLGGGVFHNLASNGTSTSVTLTYAATTTGAQDVMLFIQP